MSTSLITTRWPTAPLSAVAEIERDLIAAESIPTGTMYVGLENVTREGTFIGVRTVANGELASTKFRFTCDHVLYGKLRPYLSKIALPDFGGVCSTDILPIRPGKQLDGRFLFYFLRLPKMVELAASRTIGANLPRLSPRDLADFPIPLPPLAEQERIADILDKADAIRRKRRSVQDEFVRMPLNVFYDLYGDPVSNPKVWTTDKLGNCAVLDRGRSRHRPRDAAFLYGGRYPLIQTGDIANANGYIMKFTQTYSEEGLAQSKLWPAGTLCITIAANIAKTATLTFPACFPDSVVGLVPGDRLTTEYVRFWFVAMEKAIDAAATQVAQKNINLELLRGLDIQVPPLDLQEQFSRTVQHLKNAESKAAQASGHTDALFEALVHRAFRGEL